MPNSSYDSRAKGCHVCNYMNSSRSRLGGLGGCNRLCGRNVYLVIERQSRNELSSCQESRRYMSQRIQYHARLCAVRAVQASTLRQRIRRPSTENCTYGGYVQRHLVLGITNKESSKPGLDADLVV